MVTIIEPVCKKWEHEIVNAGLLKLIGNLTVDEVSFWGEGRHVNAVMSLMGENRIIPHSLDSVPDRQTPNKSIRCFLYCNLIMRIIETSRPNVLVITAAYDDCIRSVQFLSKIYRNIRFCVVLHSMVDPRFGDTELYIKTIIDHNRENICYITYSPYCRDLFLKRGINNVFFLHHPYILQNGGRRVGTDIVNVGVIGACSNMNAARIARELSYDKASDIRFRVFSRNWREMRGIDGVIIEKEEFERDDMDSIMSQIDYLLLPYGKNDYKLSASGVMWDAVSYSKPCITYDSDYLSYYQNRCGIGYVCESLSELKRRVESLRTEKRGELRLFKNLDIFDKENLSVISKIVLN